VAVSILTINLEGKLMV